MKDLKKLKKGKYIIHENEACVIKNLQFLNNQNNPVIKLELEGLFSGKHYSSHILTHENIQEADLARKCGTIISKKNNKIEIMDITTFETFEANISPELLEKAKEGDNITFVHSKDTARILEVRK